MKRLTFPVPASLRGERLRGEVETAVGGPCSVSVTLANELEIIVPDDADEPLVAATVAAHSGAPTAEEAAEQTIRQADIDTMRAYLNASGPTAAQTVQAVKALIRAMRAVAG